MSKADARGERLSTSHYTIASSADSQDIIQLLAKVFSESDPPAVAAGVSSQDIENFLELVVPAMLGHALTITARDEKGQLTGALLTEDFALFPEFDQSLISPRIMPIMAMLEGLDRQYLAGTTVSPGEYAHLFMLAVDPQFSGGGIAKRLVAVCVENGTCKGYRMAVTEATGNVSQHIFRKHGFVERVTTSYQEFRFNGNSPFAGIQEHRGAILMDRSLR